MSHSGCSLRLGSRVTALESHKGFHDFKQAFISPEDADDMLVSKHEGTHDKFLLETSFGNAQLAFRRLAEYAGDQQVKYNADLWLEMLASASRTTHEAGATYLSIKLFDSNLQPELFSSCPEEYKQYFRLLSDVIDPVLKASYVQYILGKIIVEVCLAFPMFERLSWWCLEMPIEVFEDEKPDQRLRILLPVIKAQIDDWATSVGEALSKKSSESIPETFDFQSEDSWLSLSIRDSADLEAELHKLTRQWIYPIAENLFRCVKTNDELIEHTKQFLGNIQKQTGIDLNDDGLWAVAAVEKSQDYIRSVRAIREGSTSIDNSQMARQVVLKHLPETSEPLSIFTQPPGPRVFITDSLKNTDLSSVNWNRFIVHDNSQIVVANKITHVFFRRAITIRNQLGLVGLPIPAAGIVVVGLHTDTADFSNALSSEIISCFSIAQPNKVLFVEGDQVIWYIGGDFFKWYSSITASGTVETLALYKEGTTSEVSADLMEKYKRGELSIKDSGLLDRVELSVVWLILRSPAFTGLFLRIMPAGSFHDMSDWFLRDLEQGVQKPIPVDERQKIADKVLQARIPIMLSWEQY